MAVKTRSKVLEPVSARTEQTLFESLHQTLDTASRLPSYLSIHLLDADSAVQYLQHLSQKATDDSTTYRPRAHFIVNPDSEDIPQDLAERLTNLQASYSDWHTKTNITENFSSDNLTVRLSVKFDKNGKPTSPEVSVSFSMWGLPESGIPTFEEMLTYRPPTVASSPVVNDGISHNSGNQNDA